MLRLIERNADDACDGNERENLRDGRRDRAELERLEAKPADAVVDVRKAPFLEVVGVAHLDEALGLVGFLHARDHAAEKLLAFSNDLSDARRDEAKGDGQTGNDDERDKRELPVLPKEDDEKRGDLHGVAHENGERADGARKGRSRLVDELGTHAARRVLLEFAFGPVKDVLEEQASHGEEDRLAHLRHQVGAHHGAEGEAHRDGDERDRRRIDHPAFLLIEAQVGHLAEQRGRDGRHACGTHQKDARKAEPPLVGHEVAVEPDQVGINHLEGLHACTSVAVSAGASEKSPGCSSAWSLESSAKRPFFTRSSSRVPVS